MNESIESPRIIISRYEPMLSEKLGRMVPGVVSVPTELYSELHRFRDGAYSMLVKEVRAINDKKERDIYKAGTLPAFTFSALIRGKRATENIERHSGVLVIDIDEKGLTTFLEQKRKIYPVYTLEDFRDEICRLDDLGRTNIVFAGLSCSANGIFIIFKIDPKRHLESFEAIAWEFKTHYNIYIDEACKDIVRLRFATFDPTAVINTWDVVDEYYPPEEFFIHQQAQEEAQKTVRENKKRIVSSATEGATKVIETAVSMINKAVPGERHTVLVRASRLLGGYVAGGVLDADMAKLALQTAVAEKQGWDDPIEDMYRAIDWGIEKGMDSPLNIHILSPEDPQWNYYNESSDNRQEQLRALYMRIFALNRQGVVQTMINYDNLGAEFETDIRRVKEIVEYIYKNNQDEFNIDNFPAVVKHEVYLKKRWEFALNEITQELFCRMRGSGKAWERIGVEDVYLMVSKTGFKCNFDEIKRLFKTNSLVQKYNPVHEYFKQVAPLYDGKTDYIDKLSRYLSIADAEPEYFSVMLKKMLVRTVKCALEVNYVNRYVFVMASEKQNTGKSWFLRWLSPWGMDRYYAETPMEEHKDSRIRMCEVLIYNLEELQTLTKVDVNRLKAIISQGSIKERRPYAHNSETIPRLCSFFGSTNRTRFLTDDTNTRWLIFNVTKINWNYRKEISIKDIWAQAASLYYAGYDCELTPEESYTRDFRNAEYSEDSFEESLLLMYFQPGILNAGGNNKMVTSTDIATRLMNISGNTKLNISAVTIGRFLNKHNFPSQRKNGIRLFAVIPRNQADSEIADRRTYVSGPDEPGLGFFNDTGDDSDPPF